MPNRRFQDRNRNTKEWESLEEYAKVLLQGDSLIECNKITEIQFSRRLMSLTDVDSLTADGIAVIDITAKFLWDLGIQLSHNANTEIKKNLEKVESEWLNKLLENETVDVRCREDAKMKSKCKMDFKLVVLNLNIILIEFRNKGESKHQE